MAGEMIVILLHCCFKTHTNSWKNFHNTFIATGIAVKKNCFTVASPLFNFLNQEIFS
ncbi:hypothetical protein AZO1586I_1050 [Bathymodiolus thermophilus thioautotrophic gill symbiont]|jgi:hypothetical protein|nr:hypothetical protein AZO1586I_1050 [Bathymodiolus thermophilus thioautotrophic gill symbiont]CAC9511275.1 hypothetical protein [uncultured Gammaproteobacteria bacterium]CAC9532226.1 hypothetical protein [uncultured Gammaproteobacteria bacterium]CAC9991851.1 hypothetical protein [uncultured Gammaproteobacteria bacterium]